MNWHKLLSVNTSVSTTENTKDAGQDWNRDIPTWVMKGDGTRQERETGETGG